MLHRLGLDRFALAIAVVIASGALSMTSSSAEDGKPFRRTISVSASGTATVVPDRAHISLGVASDAATAREALKANSGRMREVIESLKATGIAAKDIQTSNFSVDARYQHFKDGRPPKVVGYRVSNNVRLTVRDIAKLGEVLDRVVDLGSNQIGGIQFSVSDEEKLRDDARRDAMANARRRAELYAKAAGADVGEVLTISETITGGPSRPMPMARSAMAADATPIEAGSQDLTITVHVVWSLR